MAYEFKITRRVEFSDTDSAGMMHFSNYFRFMEVAEHAFYRSLGFSVYAHENKPHILGWPRVHADCDFRVPLRFEDEVEIHLLVREKKSKSLTHTFIFRKNESDGKWTEVARGTLTVVCVNFDPLNQQMKAISIPSSIADKIEIAPGELLK